MNLLCNRTILNWLRAGDKHASTTSENEIRLKIIERNWRVETQIIMRYIVCGLFFALFSGANICSSDLIVVSNK